MADKHQVIALAKAHPGITSAEIAERLRCNPAYVRSTAQRNGLTLGCSRNIKRANLVTALREIANYAENDAAPKRAVVAQMAKDAIGKALRNAEPIHRRDGDEG